MNPLTKVLTVFAGVFFIASLIFTFLGAGSVEQPSTIRFVNTGEICLVVSLVLFLIRFICLISQTNKERRKTGI